MWLQEWDQLLRLVTIGLPVYIIMIVLVRLIGNRSLARMNAFDSIVSVALGSALATAIMTQELPGALAVGSVVLLLVVQFILSWLAVRVHAVKKITKSTPRLLLLRGRYLEDELRRVRLTPDAVRAAVLAKGVPRVEEVFAVVLETDGSISVLPSAAAGRPSALEGVDGAAEVL